MIVVISNAFWTYKFICRKVCNIGIIRKKFISLICLIWKTIQSSIFITRNGAMIYALVSAEKKML